MPEDAGKKAILSDFLKQVSKGLGFIEDIWIDREVKEPGTDGQYNKANSLRFQPISNLTELVNDDIHNTFEEGSFTFRFIAAKPGSGKTTLLDYFQEKIKIESKYCSNSIVVYFRFTQLLSIGGNQHFGVKLYTYLLIKTLWMLIPNNAHLPHSVREATDNFLTDKIGKENLGTIKYLEDFDAFNDKLYEYFFQKSPNLEDFFFSLIDAITKRQPSFSFVYLIDELGSSDSHNKYVFEARTIIKNLINRVFDNDYKGKINLIMYVVGISEDVEDFIRGDAALESRVSDSVITLVPFRKDECEKIKLQITKRIKDAYSGCQDFKQAWQEIEAINVEPGKDCHTLRDFCKKYGSKVAIIHEKYFKHFDKAFNIYENKAGDLVKAECQEKWKYFLKKPGYQIQASSSTTSITFHTDNGDKTHAFDCYVELLHNGCRVAKAFGEAKNYELLVSHLTTFDQWLKDAKFTPSSDNGNPPDLAFIIAPSCPSLLKRKLELKNIEFIQADKELPQTSSSNPTQTPPVSQSATPTPTPSSPATGSPVNINTASKEELVQAVKGTAMKSKTIDLIINRRQSQPYNDLNHLIADVKSTDKVKQKLQTKLDNGEICF